jgi:putative selenium metabolism protein SsnA
MKIILTNAMLVDLDPPRAEDGGLCLDGDRIAARGSALPTGPDDETIDCGGAVVLPGLVNGHTHLYSALATGMPPPSETPQNFREILERVWWRLDRALDGESIELSARIGALEALHCGTTTLIDHHASPGCIDGSLDMVRAGLQEIGLRGVLCYETTDRHGIDGRRAGLAENRRFLDAQTRAPDGWFAGLVGAHASFTLEDETLEELAALADHFESGVHIHVAEDPCDEDDCATRFQMFVIDRLAAQGVLRCESVLAHCTHLDEPAIERVNAAGAVVAHNARSNMNNAVGYAPVAEFRAPVMLGTDGIGGDLFAEAKAAWFASRHAQAGLAPGAILAMLAAGARRASSALGITLGKLEVGAAADVVVTDYRPATPLTSANLAGHLLFGLGARHVQDVMIGGRWVLRNRAATTCDERRVRALATAAARQLWERMARLP